MIVNFTRLNMIILNLDQAFLLSCLSYSQKLQICVRASSLLNFTYCGPKLRNLRVDQVLDSRICQTFEWLTRYKFGEMISRLRSNGRWMDGISQVCKFLTLYKTTCARPCPKKAMIELSINHSERFTTLDNIWRDSGGYLGNDCRRTPQRSADT